MIINTEHIKYNINTQNQLEEADVEFIKKFNPSVYHNDSSCELWAFDQKLPSGKWLENITFNNELTECKALVL